MAIMSRTIPLLIALPALAAAQSLPATHFYSGLDATSARTRIERDGKRPYGPRFEAAGMPATPAFEFFPGLRLPGQKEAFKRPNAPVQLVRPEFRMGEQDLGIRDTHDVVFFAEDRLVRFRVHLKSAGESLGQRWTKELHKYFDFLDRDGDGELNRYEAEFAFSTAGIREMMQTGFAYQRPDDAAALFADMDVSRDGKIQFDEFAAYYTSAANRIITVLANPVRDPYADILTEELFKLLDTNKDGRLSRAELTAIEELFATLDADEDECLSALEIVPTLLSRPPQPRTSADPKAAPMMVFPSGEIPPAIIETILDRYDKNKNGVLDKSENPFSNEVFRLLDKNKNGEVSVTELVAWGQTPPDLELEMTFGPTQDQCSVKLLPAKDGKPSPLAAAFKSSVDGNATFTIGNQTIQWAAYSPRGVYGQATRVSPFQFFDNGRGYLTEKDLAGPQSQALRVLFDMIDRDGDGKMTRAEFDAFFALQQGFTSLPLTLTHSTQTPSLFQVIDTNGDGRLSVREVRGAFDRLIALEPNGKDFVTRAALTPQGAIRFGRTSETVGFNPVTMYNQPAPRQTSRGPLWFRKFDRNGDGELSRKEFPGTKEEFDKIDTNHDGFISVEEAEAYDKLVRGDKPARKK
jgi:Ca2+-binding EF-hand superfamily protein